MRLGEDLGGRSPVLIGLVSLSPAARARRERRRSQARRRVLTRNPMAWHLDLGLLGLQDREKEMSVAQATQSVWLPA